MGGAPGFPEQVSQTKVLVMGFIPGCLRAVQPMLSIDEACWKAASQVGKSSGHTGVDHSLARYLLTVQLCPLL